MLPAGRGGRLAAVLAAALREGAERRRELERRAARSGALLRRWAAEDEGQPEAGGSTEQENSPSPQELQELELLNRALERALKVRRSVQKTPLEAQGDRGEKAVSEGPAPRNTPVQQALVSSEGVAVATRARAISKKPTSSKKPSSYLLRAPYRTDPEVNKTHRKAAARHTPRAPSAAGKSPSKAVVVSKQARRHRLASGARNREVGAAAASTKTIALSTHGLLKQQSVSPGDLEGQENSVAASSGSMGESSREEEGRAEDASRRSRQPQTDTLQEQGSRLKLPLPYRKAYSRNSRAWESCRLCQTRADAAAARNRFIERIQTTFEFCSPLPAFSPAEIEEEIKVLQDVPSLLSQSVEAEPAEHPTLQQEYESLLTLEGLQTIASQCLHKLQCLREAAESHARLCPDCAAGAGICSPAHAPPGDAACGCAAGLAAPLLCYSSLQELQDLFALKLHVAMLNQEIAMQKVTTAELLPALDSSLCAEASAHQLYRAIYTQLCEGGQRFPALVRDELAE